MGIWKYNWTRIFPSSPQASSTGKRCDRASNNSRTPLRYQRISAEPPDTYGHTSCRPLTLFPEKIRISSVASALNILGQGNWQTDIPCPGTAAKNKCSFCIFLQSLPQGSQSCSFKLIWLVFYWGRSSRCTSCFINAMSQQNVDFKTEARRQFTVSPWTVIKLTFVCTKHAGV